jgi:hypothetical protein
MRQEDCFAPGPIVFPRPLTDHHRIEGGGLEIAAIGLVPMLGGPILGIGGQPRDPHHRGLQTFGAGRFALPMAPGGLP